MYTLSSFTIILYSGAGLQEAHNLATSARVACIALFASAQGSH